jgi:methanogenic corrinoid protein MtbC1
MNSTTVAKSPSLARLSTLPIFNTKAVARETGVPADTFRAWERRYGVPRPRRTAGGHRLYSERDIAIIRWLRDRTDDGVNISHAVMLLSNMLDPPADEPADHSEARAIKLLVGEFVQALVKFDLARAERLLSEAFSIYAFEHVLIDLIQPAMIEIGEYWQRGEINVGVEHFATQFVQRKLGGLINAFEGGRQRGPIVLGCAPSELHDLGATIASLFLARRGWNVVYLGPQVPLIDLLATVRSVNPSMVCLSASTIETAMELITVARSLKEAYPTIPFGYGGRIFNTNPEICTSISGMFLGHDAREFVERVSTLVSPTSAPPAD